MADEVEDHRRWKLLPVQRNGPSQWQAALKPCCLIEADAPRASGSAKHGGNGPDMRPDTATARLLGPVPGGTQTGTYSRSSRLKLASSLVIRFLLPPRPPALYGSLSPSYAMFPCLFRHQRLPPSPHPTEPDSTSLIGNTTVLMSLLPLLRRPARVLLYVAVSIRV